MSSESTRNFLASLSTSGLEFNLRTPSFAALAIAALLVISVSIFHRWSRTSPYNFIPGPKPSTILGFLPDIHNENSLNWHLEIPQKFGHVARLRGGLLGPDGLYISDPLALHSILVREQNWFRESNEFAGLFGIIHCGDGMASVYGTEHKKQRKLVDPVLTAARVSRLTPLFYTVTGQMQAALKSAISKHPEGAVVDILDYFTRTALEVISQGAIGHTFNSFDKESKEYAEFHEAITTVLPLASQLFPVMSFFQTWRKIRPVWLRRSLAKTVDYIPWPSARKFKHAVETMHPIYTSVYAKKKQAFHDVGGDTELLGLSGRDLTTGLIKANWEASDDDQIADDVIMANMSSIVHGGQETTSAAMSRLVDIISSDPILQSKLRAEVLDAKAKKANGEDLDYNELNELPLLDALCRETFRLYSPVTFVWRQTIKDTMVPLQYPIRDVVTGKETREILILKDTSVYIGLSAANRSTAIWGEDAAEFKPERWLNKDIRRTIEETSKLPGIYSNTMTFLGGGRACPGMKFALLEIKLVLSVLLTTFSLEPAEGAIDWKMGITLTPFLKGQEAKGPQVPVKIALL